MVFYGAADGFERSVHAREKRETEAREKAEIPRISMRFYFV